MSRSILFVDDERQILRALNRLFVGSDYTIFLKESGEETLLFLKDNPVDLIVSDIRMPGMTGFELLAKVKEKYPKIMRVALSGFTDSKQIYKALEDNVAKMYLFKPWDNKELTAIIDNLFALEGTLKDKRILELINNLSALPTLPHLYMKIKEMINSEEDVERIAKIIESDQATAAKILRIANSAYYGNKTGSISQAIMYIGLTNIKSIVLSSSMFTKQGFHKDKMELIWRGATLTNRFTNLLYTEFLNKKIPLVYASAGLLHNIGMVLLLSSFGERYATVLKELDANGGELLDIEMAHLGVTHQEIGGYLLNWWEMPIAIIEAALYHHTPLDERILNKELLCAIYIANAMVWRRLDKHDYNTSIYLKGCCDFLSIDLEKVDVFFKETTIED